MKLNRYLSQALLCLILAGVVTSCKQNPKELGTFPLKANSGVQEDNLIKDIHQIKVKEVYPSTKYLYLFVQEGDRSYWVATSPAEVNVGDTYYYNEALVMTDFESKEMGKVYDTLYLVTQLVTKSHGENMKLLEKDIQVTDADAPAINDKGHSMGMYREATKVTIGELLSDPGSFEGKMVEIQGLCTKINTNILGRNWIHLQEGDQSENTVVVTSQWLASPGDEIKMRALVALDKDFGSGYTYEVLLEEGILVK